MEDQELPSILRIKSGLRKELCAWLPHRFQLCFCLQSEFRDSASPRSTDHRQDEEGYSSQNVTPPNCSGEQRQAPERSQLLTSQCKNEFPFPLCLFWQFHFIFPGIQSANHPSGSPCSGNEGISHLPFHSLFPLCCHY